MESLEWDNEEAEHNDFVVMMRIAKVHNPKYYTYMVEQIGDPDAYPWRNWDIFGSVFYCFTLMTTIGYGTFTPQTWGGKLFSIIFAIFAIPFAAWSYGNLGPTIVDLSCQPFIKWRVDATLRSWPAYEEVNKSGNGVHREDALAALNKTRVWIGKPELKSYIEESVGEGEHLDAEQYEELKIHVRARHEQAMACFLCIDALLVYIIIGSIVYPVVTRDEHAIDGIYCVVITLTTVGLGDYTYPYGATFSLHGQFGFFQFCQLSIGLALLAAVVGNVWEMYSDIRSMVRITERRLARAVRIREKSTKKTEEITSGQEGGEKKAVESSI